MFYRKWGRLPVPGRNAEVNGSMSRAGVKSTILISILLALLLLLSPAALAANLGFTSDVHGSTDNLSSWLEKLKDDVTILDHMILGGDYEGAAVAQQCAGIVQSIYQDTPCILVRGNHDPVSPIFETGLIYEDDEYAVYVVDSAGLSFADTEISDLAVKLKQIKASKPVFVASHCPIHYFSGRYTSNADALLKVLNQHENVVFLWGHNHTVKDPYYGQVLVKGDKIITTSGGAEQAISFTYLSYGAMRDGNNGANGLLASLEKNLNGTQIDFAYRDLSGTRTSGDSIVIADLAAEEHEANYQLVPAPVSGETYVIAAKSGDKYYALTTEKFTTGAIDYLEGDSITVAGDHITSNVTDDMLWKFAAHGQGFNIINDSSNYLYRKSGGSAGIYLNNNGNDAGYADWIYTDSEKSLRLDSTLVSDKFYLLLKNSGTDYYFANVKNDPGQGEIYLFKLTEDTPAETFAVTFDSKGGSAVAAITGIQKGATITLPAPPVKAEFNFAGWFTDDTTFVSPFTDSTPVNADLTVYAKWTAEVVPGSGYQLVPAPANGETYVIVAKSGDKYYALTTEKFTTGTIDYLKGTNVTVSGDYIISNVTAGMLWDFTTSGQGYNIKNGANYLNRKAQASAGIYLKTQSDGSGYADWIYTAGDKSLRTDSTQVSDKFYLLLKNSGTDYYFANDKTDRGEIYLYKAATTGALTGITITKQPNKTSYIAGQSFDPAGMEVTAQYNDGTSAVVTDYSLAPAGALTTNDKKITITYQGKNADIAITVADKSLTGISITQQPNKTSYIAGQNFDPAGMEVTAQYNDGTSAVVTDYSWAPAGALSTDDKKITLTYEGMTAVINISVTAKQVTGIQAVFEQGTTVIYTTTPLDSLKAILEVTADFNDGSSSLLAAADYTLSGTFTEGVSTITVKYGDNEDIFTVNVTAGELTGISITQQPDKIKYTAGQSFAPAGMEVTAQFSDGSSAVVSDYSYAPKGALAITDTKITVTFGGYSAKLTITVTAGSGGGGGGGGGSVPAGILVTPAGKDFSESGISLSFPAGAVNEDVFVQVKETSLTSSMILPAGSKLISPVAAVSKDKAGDFIKPVTIGIPFDKSSIDLGNYILQIYRFNDKSAQWEELEDTVVMAATGTVTGETYYTGKFAVIALPRAIAVETEPLPAAPPAPVIPADISSHWAADNIIMLINAGILSGYPDGSFQPDKTVTRAEFAVMLVKSLQLQSPSTVIFADITSHWARESIAIALAHGIVSGFDQNTFGPDHFITREQAAAMTVRAVKLPEIDTELNFTDSEQIASWARSSVAAAVDSRILTGYPDRSFQPQGKLTRAEAATIIAGLL